MYVYDCNCAYHIYTSAKGSYRASDPLETEVAGNRESSDVVTGNWTQVLCQKPKVSKCSSLLSRLSNAISFFSIVKKIPWYVCIMFTLPFVCWQISRFVPNLSYGKERCSNHNLPVYYSKSTYLSHSIFKQLLLIEKVAQLYLSIIFQVRAIDGQELDYVWVGRSRTQAYHAISLYF